MTDIVQTSAGDAELETLLARCGNGDRAAFSTLYRATSSQILAVLTRMLTNRDAAEDALQDVFVRVWQHAADYRPERGRPRTWLISIARYRALDLLRRSGRERPLEEAPLGASGAPVRDHAPSARLARCLGELNEEQRRSICLAYLDGLTHGEIAQALQAPLGTAKSWVRRGLEALRRCLEQ